MLKLNAALMVKDFVVRALHTCYTVSLAACSNLGGLFKEQNAVQYARCKKR